MFKKLFAVVLLFILISSVPATDQNKSEIWMTYAHPEQLSAPGAQWDFVQQRLDVLEVYINTIAWSEPGTYAPLAEILKKNNIKVAVECGYFDWDNKETKDWTGGKGTFAGDIVRQDWHDQVGEETARIEIDKLEKLFKTGISPAYLNLDGSIRRMTRPGQDVNRNDVKGFDDLDRCVTELIDYMKAWRVRFPEIQFFVCANLPNWGWRGQTSYYTSGMFNGDYYPALEKIIQRSREAGVPIAGVTADYPYEYFAGINPHQAFLNYANEAKPTAEPKDPAKVDWPKRILDVEQYVESQGLEFNFVCNTEKGGGKSGEEFSRLTLEYLEASQKAGLTPRRYIIQSWYNFPKRAVPESDAGSMTGLVKRVMEKLGK